MTSNEIPFGSIACKINKSWYKKKHKTFGNEIPKEVLNQYFSNLYNEFIHYTENGWEPIGINPSSKYWMRRNKSLIKINNDLYIVILG